MFTPPNNFSIPPPPNLKFLEVTLVRVYTHQGYWGGEGIYFLSPTKLKFLEITLVCMYVCMCVRVCVHVR